MKKKGIRYKTEKSFEEKLLKKLTLIFHSQSTENTELGGYLMKLTIVNRVDGLETH